MPTTVEAVIYDQNNRKQGIAWKTDVPSFDLPSCWSYELESNGELIRHKRMFAIFTILIVILFTLIATTYKNQMDFERCNSSLPLGGNIFLTYCNKTYDIRYFNEIRPLRKPLISPVRKCIYLFTSLQMYSYTTE